MARTDRASRLILAPPLWVYRALVDPRQLVLWLPPRGARAIIDEFDPRPGGAFAMTLVFADPAKTDAKSAADSDVVRGRFVDLVPGSLVTQCFEFESADPAFAGAMQMTWTLEPDGAGTRLTVTAENVPPGISAEDHQQGLNSSLENLSLLALLRD